MFHDFIETFMQVYIDNIVIKSSSKSGHLDHLRYSFKRMRKHGLQMNPLNYSFYVHAGGFLCFVVHKKGIEINSNKTKAIQNTKPPANKKQLQSLLGNINFMRRLISNVSGKTKVFSPLPRLKKEEGCIWEPKHQQAFDNTKMYSS